MINGKWKDERIKVMCFVCKPKSVNTISQFTESLEYTVYYKSMK